MSESVGLSPRAAGKVREATEDYFANGPRVSGAVLAHRGRGGMYEGKLTSALRAGTLAAPTTATVTLWHPDPASAAAPVPFLASTESIAVVNRSASLTGAVGTYVIVTRMASEWRVLWSDCGV